jgi:DNA-binding transcriptional MerR regulator
MKAAVEGFKAIQVQRITGVPYQTLNYWAKIGLVKPSVTAASGRGSRRVYDFRDLVAIRVALRLRHAGVFGKAMIRILEVLRLAGFESPTDVAIQITRSGKVAVKSSAGSSSASRRPGQLLLNFTCDCRAEAAELRDLLQARELNSADNSKAGTTGCQDLGRGSRRAKEAREENMVDDA